MVSTVVRSMRNGLICVLLYLAPAPFVDLAAQETAPEVDRLLMEGKRQLNDGQYTQAVDSFNRVLEIEPQNAEALFFLISSEAAMHSKNNPQVASLLARGKQLIDAGNYKQAEAVFNRVLAIDPSNARALTYLFTLKGVQETTAPQSVDSILQAGRNLINAGQVVPAKSLFERVLELDPNNSEAYYRLGQISQSLGQKDEAVSYYKRAIDAAPENYSVRYSIGNNYEQMGLIDEAVDLYRSMVRVGAGDERWIEEARKRLALIEARRLMQEKYPDEAVLVLERARRTFPDAPELLLPLGNLYLMLDRDDEAERTLKHVIELAPEQPAGYQALATYYRKKNNAEQERHQMERILALTPRQSPLYRGALRRYEDLVQASVQEDMRKGQTDDALRNLDRFLAIVPGNVPAWLQIAAIHQKRGNLDAAESALQAALLWQPGNIVAETNLSRIYVRSNRLREAIPMLQHIVTEAPGSNAARTAMTNLFNIYEKAARALTKEEYESGIAFLKQLAERSPGDADVQYRMGTLMARERKYPEAVAFYSKALEIQPDYYGARLRIGVVEELSKDDAKAEKNYLAIVNAKGDVPADVTKKARLNLIKMYTRQGRIDEAMPFVETLADEMTSESGDQAGVLAVAFDREAQILAQLKNLDEGIKLTKEKIKQHPDDVDLALKLGIFLDRAGKFDKAVEQFNLVLKQRPDDASLYIRKGLALEKQGQIEEAKAVYRQILQLEQASPKVIRMAQLQLGRLSLREKGQEEALKVYSDLIKESPEDQSAWLGLATVRQARGEYDLAVEALSRAVALETDPKQAEERAAQILLILGQGHLADGDLEGARDIFTGATEAFPKNARAFVMLATVQSQLGELEEAVSMYKKALELEPKDFGTRWRLGLLYEQLKLDEDAIVVYRTLTHLRGISRAQLNLVESRLRAVSRRIGGLSSSMHYDLVFAKGLNQNNIDPRFSYHSTLGFNLNYQNKVRDYTTLGLRVFPTYSVYHVNQFDSIAGGGAATLSYTRQDWSLTGSYSYQENRGLLSGRRSARSRSPSLNGRWSVPLKPLIQPWARRPVDSTVRFNLNATSANSAASPFLGIRSYGAQASFSQPFTAGGWQISYQIQVLENKHPLGTDNARQSNTLSFGVSRALRPRLSASLNVSSSLLHYANEDSANAGRFRRNETLSAGLNVTYRLHDNFSLSFGYNRIQNSSNLPVGVGQIKTPEQIVTAFQSTGLGNYTNETLSARLNFNF